MQPYRIERPHDPADCVHCGPTGQGHRLCQKDGCDENAAHQVALRHATQAEYDALPEGLTPIDGIARMLVLGCEDCADNVPPLCLHPQAAPVPCPKCSAAGDDPCLGVHGGPRSSHHHVRVDAQPPDEVCLHAHREDCGVFEGCQCTEADAPPVRQPRIQLPMDHANGSRSKLPAAMVQPLVEAHDIPWWTVREYDTRLTQDNQPAIGCEYAELDADGNLADDGHGHEVLKQIVIPLEQGYRPPQLRG